MELRQLRYFIKIADLGSLSKASLALHIAQSALSQQLAQLEDELGHCLLSRLPRGVQMTAEGEIFYAHAQAVLRQISGIRDALSESADAPVGHVVVGLPQSAVPLLAVPLIGQARRRFPGVTLEFFDESAARIAQGLESGRFELGVMVNDEEASAFDSVPLLDEELLLVSRSDQAPSSEAVTARQIAGLPLVLPSPGQGSRGLLDVYFAQHGVSALSEVVLANSINIMRQMVLGGMAHAINTWGTVADDLAHGRVKATPLSPAITRRIYISSAPVARLSLAARAIRHLFIELARENVQAGHWQMTTLAPALRPR